MVDLIIIITVSMILFYTGFTLGYLRGRISVLESKIEDWGDSLEHLGNNNESSR